MPAPDRPHDMSPDAGAIADAYALGRAIRVPVYSARGEQILVSTVSVLTWVVLLIALVVLSGVSLRDVLDVPRPGPGR